MQPKPRRAAQAHRQNGVPLIFAQQDKRGKKAARADPVNAAQPQDSVGEHHDPQNRKPCPQNQGNHRRSQTGQHALQNRKIPPAPVTPRQQRDQHQRGGNAPQRGDHRPRQLGNAQPHKGGAVDRNRAGRHFGNGNQIGEFLQGHPGVQLHNLAADQRHGSVTAAHAEQPHLQKAEI